LGGGPVGGGGMQKWRFFAGFGGWGEAALLAVWMVASMAWGAEHVILAPDERAIIEKVAKSIRSDHVQYGKAPAETLGGEIAFPFRDGTITLVRATSFVREDGSISWRGIVKETGSEPHSWSGATQS
jgi:hypothetical protein